MPGKFYPLELNADTPIEKKCAYFKGFYKN